MRSPEMTDPIDSAMQNLEAASMSLPDEYVAAQQLIQNAMDDLREARGEPRKQPAAVLPRPRMMTSDERRGFNEELRVSAAEERSLAPSRA